MEAVPIGRQFRETHSSHARSAPAIIDDLINREIRSLNGDGTPERKRQIVRKNLLAVLDGFPEAQPLFTPKVECGKSTRLV